MSDISGQPAFPSSFTLEGPAFDPIKRKQIPATEKEVYIFSGLSIRQYFAAKAMQALIKYWEDSNHADEVARRSIIFADALIAALDQPKEVK